VDLKRRYRNIQNELMNTIQYNGKVSRIRWDKAGLASYYYATNVYLVLDQIDS